MRIPSAMKDCRKRVMNRKKIIRNGEKILILKGYPF